MSEEELLKMMTDYGFDKDADPFVWRLVMDVERQTRHEFFGVIQAANNAASSLAFKRRDLERFTWDCEHKDKPSDD